MTGLNKDERKKFAEERRMSPAVGFGSSFAAGMLVFSLGGHWLDNRYDKEPLFTLIGMGLGLFYGAWELWKLITIANQRAERDAKQIVDENEACNDDSK